MEFEKIDFPGVKGQKPKIATKWTFKDWETDQKTEEVTDAPKSSEHRLALVESYGLKHKSKTTSIWPSR